MMLMHDEARRIAANIAKLPERLSGHRTWGVQYADAPHPGRLLRSRSVRPRRCSAAD